MNGRGLLAAVAVAVGVGAAGGLAAGPRPAAAPVPATQEIEVLDPGVDPTGRPTPVLRPGPGGTQQLEIPPTVLVHRFYYTGDRRFQGPMLPGGPVLVSVNHPKTLERVTVPVTLPPGAPQVVYTGDTIRYDYGPQSVCLKFGLFGKPSVHYSQNSVAGDKAHDAFDSVVTGTKNLALRTGIPQATAAVASGTKKLAVAGADGIYYTGRFVAVPVANVASRLPGAQLFRSSAEDRAVRDQQRLGRVADRRPDPDRAFIPRTP